MRRRDTACMSDSGPPANPPEQLAMTRPHKGRGAASNPEGRFESVRHQAEDDGWQSALLDEDAPRPRTEVTEERARRVISRNDSPDIAFDQAINPYRGCEHGCIYCFVRPSHSYLNLSPGLDFETKLRAKGNFAEVLREELARPGYVVSPINIGSNTDPYQPIEKRWRLTRAALELLAACHHPCTLVTKNALVAPIIPALNDKDMEGVLAEAAAAGARSAGYTTLRLPYALKALFREWLSLHAPQRAEHGMSLIQQMNGGRDYNSNFATRMQGSGVFADLLRRRFELACRKHGFARARELVLDASRFVPPCTPSPQGVLF